ncbi:helix-turn-helix transcriptional regulator [Streptomyces sp. SID13031]|uniref:helix-turn-helix domain-containing protein n=1 Tax=Streptomyces sp. SID13031 TaxID=2706046 RepID=UPI0013C7FBEA|nr:helix-turn-helix transcriptional regulator [Streptomyces sp. SID13031]NEA32297.1 helix-turn-helix transcriptional regulator [Streptomyces sp. SID13031]
MPKATKRQGQPERGKQPEPAESLEHRITIHLDELLIARNMTLVDLAARVGVTVANLSILKNGHARAVRFSTLTAICDALDCTPADLIGLERQ